MTPSAKSQAERFLAAYNQLDDYMRRELREGPGVGHQNLIVKMAAQESDFSRGQSDLQTFARLRNALVHNPYSPGVDPIAEPHESVVEEYEKIVQRLLHPPSCLTIAVPASAVYATNWDQHVLEVVRVMNSKVYTHVPVLEDGRVVGVFSENTVFSYLADHGQARISSETRISEFREFMPVRKHASEVFGFLSETSTIVDLARLFQETFKLRQRLAVVFITDNGQETGRLLGLVTAWDMAGAGTG
jgi:CBS domain-containing protein